MQGPYRTVILQVLLPNSDQYSIYVPVSDHMTTYRINMISYIRSYIRNNLFAESLILILIDCDLVSKSADSYEQISFSFSLKFDRQGLSLIQVH